MTVIRVSLRYQARLLASLLILAAACAFQSGSASAQDSAVDAALRDILATGQPPVTDIDAAIGAEPLAALKRIYAARNDRPIWVGASGLSPAAERLLRRVPELPAPPPLPSLIMMAAAHPPAEPRALAVLDLLLSAAYGVAAVDAKDPLTTPGLEPSLTAIGAASDAAALLADTLPADPAFWRLKEGIADYRALAAAGGWPSVPDGPKLQAGDQGPRVDALRRRLAVTGDLAIGLAGSDFDPALDQAVKHFQARHGLDDDGVVGARTLQALNQPVAKRLAIMAANLLRLQKLHRDWGPRYIVVNIAAAAYRLVEDGRTVFVRPAVVGKPSWPTPTLDGVIDKVEFHPYWRIPMRIADEEVWPKQDADPNYFTEQGIHIFDDQLRQDPGPSNPLGTVKFIFDNPFSVYLHDTTAPRLFDQAYRFSSHGCIRVSAAGDLAKELLSADPSWSGDKVAAALQGSANRTVPLARPIAIHIVYDTAWVDEDGTVEFRDDIYGRDRLVPVTGEAPPLQVAAANPAPPAASCDG